VVASQVAALRFGFPIVVVRFCPRISAKFPPLPPLVTRWVEVISVPPFHTPNGWPGGGPVVGGRPVGRTRGRHRAVEVGPFPLFLSFISIVGVF